MHNLEKDTDSKQKLRIFYDDNPKVRLISERGREIWSLPSQRAMKDRSFSFFF